MPTLKFHGVPSQIIEENAPEILEKLTKIFATAEENINLLVDTSKWISRNGNAETYPLIEVLSFPRPEQTQEQVAQTLYQILQRAGFPETEVFFNHLTPAHYYNNGKHF